MDKLSQGISADATVFAAGNKKLINRVSYICYFFTGALITTLGVVLGPVSAAFNKDPGFIGQTFSLLNIGLFLPILIGGLLMQKVSSKLLLMIAAVVTIVMAAMLSIMPSITMLGATVFVVGAAAGITMAVGSYLVVRINPDPQERSSSLIFTDFFFSFAGITLPMLLGYLFKHNVSWLATYIIMGLISVLLLLLVAKARFPQVEKPVKSEKADEKWGKAVYFICFAAFAFIYAELTFMMWLPTHLQEVVKLPVDTAANYISLYWGCKAAGLWINHYTVRYVALRLFLVVSAVIGMAAVVMIANVPSATVAMIALAVFGFFNSGIYSGLISYGSLQVKSASPTLVSTVLTSGSVGTLIFASISAWLFTHYGLSVALNSSAVVYALCLIGIVLGASTSVAEKLHGKISL